MSQMSVTTYDGKGKVVGTSTITVPQEEVNRQALRDKVVQALATNATYLGRSAPTVAQNTAQTQALTRQVDAIIRLLVTGDTSDISGT